MTKPILAPDFPLQSERLLYRPYEDADASWLFPLRQSAESMRFVPFGGETEDELGDVLAKRKEMKRIAEPGQGMMCVMVEKESGEAVGELMLRAVAGRAETGEVGFVLRSEYYRNGYATEGALKMLQLGFEDAGFHRIIGICDAENVASRATLTKIGMREEALHRSASLMKGEWRDENVFAILRDEWCASQR